MAETELLLATQNPGKLAEMRQLVAGLPFRVVGPRDLGITEAPEETGTTFLQNAIIKARWYAERSGLLAVADDSGLSVDALDGAPGLYSARFGGEGATDDDRNRLLLQMLEGVSPEQRGAHFTSAVAVARGDVIVFEAVETVAGFIAPRCEGRSGFGYDPLFFYPPFAATFGMVEPARKDSVSHRGKAFARLREGLRQMAATSAS